MGPNTETTYFSTELNWCQPRDTIILIPDLSPDQLDKKPNKTKKPSRYRGTKKSSNTETNAHNMKIKQEVLPCNTIIKQEIVPNTKCEDNKVTINIWTYNQPKG